MPPKRCQNCGKQLDPDEGVDTIPGTKILVCGTCYKQHHEPELTH